MLSKFGILVVAVFFVSTFFLWFSQFRFDHSRISLAGTELDVLLAKTPRQWHKGVGGKKTLEPYDGMFFLFSEFDRHTMVMRNTLFPLDIIWFDRGIVVDIAPNVPLEPGKKEGEFTRYYPRVNANMVLEVPAGFVQKKGLKIGDKLSVLDED